MCASNNYTFFLSTFSKLNCRKLIIVKILLTNTGYYPKLDTCISSCSGFVSSHYKFFVSRKHACLNIIYQKDFKVYKHLIKCPNLQRGQYIPCSVPDSGELPSKCTLISLFGGNSKHDKSCCIVICVQKWYRSCTWKTEPHRWMFR